MPSRTPLLRRLAGPMVVASAGVVMLIATWGTWPDPITDFGKEIYLAWRLSLGERLYTDVAYHLGPLSPYLNAMVFRVFSPTLLTLELFNLAICTAILVLMYRLIEKVAGRLAAVVASVTFVTLFAFTHFTPIADYNYICPYDHAHTHGILLGLIGMTAADRFNRTGKQRWVFVSGLAVGLAFLTRTELFLAAAAGAATILCLPRRFRSPAVFLVGFLIPILITWVCLGWRAVEGSWPVVLDRSVAANPFYRDSMGTLDIKGSLLRMIRWTGWWGLILLPPLAIPRRWNIAVCIWGALIALFIGKFQDPAEAFAPLPLALVGCAILLKWRSAETKPLAAGLIVFALVLLAKIILNARIYHYGFVLAMPATLLVVAVGVGWASPGVRAAMLGAIGVVIAGYLHLGFQLIAQQTYTVGEGANQFRADARGAMLEDTLQALRLKKSANQTLAVMPEGAMLNFLAEMPNSTPYWSFNPPYSFFAPGQAEATGEQKIVLALQARPPDWVVLVPENLTDFGTPFFGKDYGLRIYAFVRKHYHAEYAGKTGMVLMRYNGQGDQRAVSTAQ
jgi:hypothetical protein